MMTVWRKLQAGSPRSSRRQEIWQRHSGDSCQPGQACRRPSKGLSADASFGPKHFLAAGALGQKCYSDHTYNALVQLSPPLPLGLTTKWVQYIVLKKLQSWCLWKNHAEILWCHCKSKVETNTMQKQSNSQAMFGRWSVWLMTGGLALRDVLWVLQGAKCQKHEKGEVHKKGFLSTHGRIAGQNPLL